MALIYKIIESEAWVQAVACGRLLGAPVDLADGFIHFSTAEQVAETAAKHFGGRDGLLLVAFDDAAFGDKLIYEASRGGALFPHLYAPLPTALALFARPLPLRADGAHDFAGLLP